VELIEEKVWKENWLLFAFAFAFADSKNKGSMRIGRYANLSALSAQHWTSCHDNTLRLPYIALYLILTLFLYRII
jgi:hypothetical protein